MLGRHWVSLIEAKEVLVLRRLLFDLLELVGR